SSVFTSAHCSRSAAQLSPESDLRAGRIRGPQETEPEAGRAVAVAVPTDEAGVEGRQGCPNDVSDSRDQVLRTPVLTFETEIAPVLLDQRPPIRCPVVSDGVVARVLDDLDPVSGKRFRSRVDRGPQLCAPAPGQSPLPADPTPHSSAQRSAAKVELPRAVDDADVVGQPRNQFRELG